MKEKQQAFARVSDERGKLQARIEELKRKLGAARDRLAQAKLARDVARGTAGFEDDVAAEKSVKEARRQLEAAEEAYEAAEERLEDLGRAHQHLQTEIREHEARQEAQRLEQAKQELRDRVEKSAAEFAEFIRLIATLRTLEHRTTWPEELSRVLEESHKAMSLQQLVRQGQARADRVKAGASVEEACS